LASRDQTPKAPAAAPVNVLRGAHAAKPAKLAARVQAGLKNPVSAQANVLRGAHTTRPAKLAGRAQAGPKTTAAAPANARSTK